MTSSISASSTPTSSPEKRSGSNRSTPDKKARTSEASTPHGTPRKLVFPDDDEPSVTGVFEKTLSLADDSDHEELPHTKGPSFIRVDEDSLLREVEKAAHSMPKLKRRGAKLDLSRVAQAISQGNFEGLQKQLNKAPKESDPATLLEQARALADPEDLHLFQQLSGTAQAMLANLDELPQHKLSALDLLKLQVSALEALSEYDETTYCHKSGNCPRAMTVVPDATPPVFFVHSKKVGRVQITGAYKSITNTLLVSPELQRATQTDYVRVTNIFDDDVDEVSIEELEREATIANEFNGDILFINKYTNDEGNEKIEWFEERYHTDLRPFLQFGRKANGQKLAPQLLLQVLRTIGTKLGQMHQKGYVHNDLNGSNILLKQLSDGQHKIKIGDFGETYNLIQGIARKDSTGYGSSVNTAPEYFGVIAKLPDATQQGQAEDMYALGILIYSFIYGVEIPWARVVRIAVEEPSIPKRQEAHERQLSEFVKIRTDAENCQDPFTAHLFRLALGLLDPNPATRMTWQGFISHLQV